MLYWIFIGNYVDRRDVRGRTYIEYISVYEICAESKIQNSFTYKINEKTNKI